MGGPSTETRSRPKRGPNTAAHAIGGPSPPQLTAAETASHAVVGRAPCDGWVDDQACRRLRSPLITTTAVTTKHSSDLTILPFGKLAGKITANVFVCCADRWAQSESPMNT